MGLKFYVGEMQAQASDASRMNQEANQAIASLQKSIAQFLFAPLSGKAYDSAKRYFNVVYTPICRSVTMTGEAMASAHKRLINEYQSSVSSIDTDEDQIMSQINRFEQLKQQLEHQMTVSKEVQPSLERRYINACESIAKKREQLEKFHTFNARSASFFSEYEACQQELSRGIAQVSGCKAWNGASGTFDLGKLDMTWATSINERWKNRAEAIENKRAKEFAEGMKGRYHCRVQLATGAYVWMWVTDPSKVTQADVQFNEKYKEYLDILTKPEKGLVDEYFQTITEELKTGINQKTGKPLTDLEKAQRWSTIASAIAAVAIGAYYGGKGFTGKEANVPKTPTLKENKGGKNYTLDRGKNKGKTGFKKASGANKLLKPDLLDELSKSGVKYNPDDVIMVGKDSSGKLLWLEKGNDKAGLKHIINGHVEDFNAKGIQDIPNFLHDTLKINPIKQGTGPKGPYSVYIIDGQKYTLAYGKNGFVVSFYPSK